ncbi:MAG: LuxR C-terminal-related transcriptional regulator [Bacteroidota bacterium]
MFESLQSIWKSLGVANIQLSDEELKTHIELLNHRNHINSTALNIVDLTNNNYYFIDPEIEKIYGYTKEELKDKSLSFAFGRLIFRHKTSLIRSVLHHRSFYAKLAPTEYNDYITNRELTFVDKRGSKRKILQQIIHNFYDDNGVIFAMATLFTDIGHTKKDDTFKYYIYQRSTNKLVYEKGRMRNEMNVFTKREMEIIDFISSGLSSKEIADQLHLSIHTVKTHRKNILNKVPVRNMTELIKKYF